MYMQPRLAHNMQKAVLDGPCCRIGKKGYFVAGACVGTIQGSTAHPLIRLKPLCCAPLQTLYFAEQDLMFFKHREEMLQHIKKCKIQHPPGDEIYRSAGCARRQCSMHAVSSTFLLQLQHVDLALCCSDNEVLVHTLLRSAAFPHCLEHILADNGAGYLAAAQAELIGCSANAATH